MGWRQPLTTTKTLCPSHPTLVPHCTAADASLAGSRPLTRLEREARQLVALDVEFAHVQLEDPQSKRVQLPAEVCVVDWQGTPLLRTLCNSLELIPGALDGATAWKFKGGVPYAEWQDAPPLSAVRAELVPLLTGRPVVGHNLGKDLTALGVDTAVPLNLRRDTMRYARLQGPRGFGRTLAQLTEAKLGRVIQAAARHDPAEDAVAALDLYLQYCHFDPDLMGYEDLVELYASQLVQGGGGDEEQGGQQGGSQDLR